MDLPEIIGGKYRPRSILGVGATGTVYCVEHTFTGDLLALKVLQPHLSASPDAIARFRGEARTAAKLRGRHVVRIFDADVARELGGAPYLVMELLEGNNLDEMSGENEAIAPETVVDWLRQAAVPLERAHRLGIVHRDLKPENLFLTTVDHGESVLKVLDFGIARISESPGMTRSGELFGTPLYMAPEQARGDLQQIGPATDVFAMGLIAYKLLTGSEYRLETGLAQMLSEILNDPPQAPSQRGYPLGDAFDRWFLQSCDLDPSRRFTSVREQIEVLAAAFGLESKATDGPPSSGRSNESARSSSMGLEVVEAHVSLPSERVPGSLRATTIDRAAPKPSGLDRIATLSGAGVEDVSFRPNGWRAAFFVVCVMSGIALGGSAWWRAPRPVQAAASRPAGGPTDTGAAARAVDDPPSVAAAPRALAPAPEPTKPITTAMRPAANESVRAVPARAIPTPPSPAHKVTADDDPLSDQK